MVWKHDRVSGADGKPRCGWVSDDPLYQEYHDTEWGRPLRDDRALFELLTLEGCQAGLSWITVLRKREHYRKVYDGFDPEKIARMARINAFHVSLFAEFLGKLKATSDGEGSLLDHSLLLYGSGIGNPNIHDHTNLPILVAGGGATGLKGNRHLRHSRPTPLANLHLTLLDRVGVRLDRFADSQGKVDGLFEPLPI